MGKRLNISLRKVQDFNSKVLVIPFRNLKLDYYPGNYVLSGGLNYREKLQKKGVDLEKGGKIYFQKAVGLSYYKGIAFLRIDDTDENTIEFSLNEGIETIIRDVAAIKA